MKFEFCLHLNSLHLKIPLNQIQAFILASLQQTTALLLASLHLPLVPTRQFRTPYRKRFPASLP